MDDAALAGKVMAALQALVAQPRGGAVGGRRHRAAPGLAADNLDVKMIDRHRDQIIDTAKRTSERRISRPPSKNSRAGLPRLSRCQQPYSLQRNAQLSSLHQ